MKKIIRLLSVIIFCFILFGCKKDKTPTPSSFKAACVLKSESTLLSGNNATYEYSYDAKGNITSVSKYVGGAYHVLDDSLAIFDKTTVSYNRRSTYPTVFTTNYNGSLFEELLPSKAEVAMEEKGITTTDIYTYFFFYDAKGRLMKVGEQTDNVIGDWEYDLTITYNDQDNVIALSYENTTGPRGTTTITATGYDDKPTPYAGMPHWYFFMHAAWNNYNPEPLFTALSKNNPLGYSLPDQFKSEMTYTYNDKGFPIQRTTTQTNSTGSYTYNETFVYQCQ